MTLLVLCFSIASGQTEKYYKYSETGQPFVKYFSPKIYGSNFVNWSIAEDKRGVMYFGNNSGILEFDGNSWRPIPVPNSVAVRSLTSAADGTIYVCASFDFGFLQPDSAGRLTYQSLKPLLDKKYQKYGEMWDVVTSTQGVFYKTKDKIFKWDGRQITVIDSVFAFRLYKIGDTIYSRNQGVGLMQIEGNSLKVMPDGEFFANIGVFNMLPFGSETGAQKRKILITTNGDGLFIHDGRKFSPFKTDVDSFLIKNQIYNACILADGNFAFATQRGGVVIIDPDGRLVRYIDEDSGLPTKVVYDVYTDRQGGLWMATIDGIARYETPSPFSIFQNSGVLKNRSNSVLRFDNTIYVTNDFGVLYLSEKNSAFQLVERSNKPAYALNNINDVLWACTLGELVSLKNKKFDQIIIDDFAAVLEVSKIYPGRIYVGTRDGLTVIQQQKSNQFQVVYTKRTDDEVHSIIEDEEGNLWLGGYFLGIYRVSGNLDALSSGNDNDVVYNYYHSANGLPGLDWRIFNIQRNMLLSTDQGVFSFNEDTQEFVPDSILGNALSGRPNQVYLVEESTNGDLWILAEQKGQTELGKAFLQKNGTYQWNPIPELRRLDLENTTALYSDRDAKNNNEILWVSTEEALVRYDPNYKKDFQISYPTLIRKVSINDDSVIYGGTAIRRPGQNEIVLPFSRNDINFEFSAVSFDKPEATLYQYFLEGNDEGWSRWTGEYRKNYTNLSGGAYTFWVRSKNIYGITGTVDSIHFTVLSPWYFTWWAYIVYGFFVLVGIFIADRIGRRIVIRKERDRAMLREAELIKKQAEELETVDKLVRVINEADDLETLFKSLLEKTISFIPQAEKAALFLLDHAQNQFKVAYTCGYQIDDLNTISFSPEELKNRYTEHSDEIEPGVYIVNKTDKLPGDEKLASFKKAHSMLVMAVEWENELEAYVVFDSFADKDAFDPSAARILNRFRVHAVSAISKARSLKLLHEKNEKIIKTQEQLLTQEKLASLGQLTAGIAHEIKNPLNFVINFAGSSGELLQELRETLDGQKSNFAAAVWSETEDVLNILAENNLRITEHGQRADNIVRSMLLHSRGKSGERRSTDINAMLEENINFVYHGFRAQDISFDITIVRDFDNALGKPEIVPQDISRVFLNLLQNAFYAATHSGFDNHNESVPEEHASLHKNSSRQHAHKTAPTIWVKTKNQENKIEIRIRDNGSGIPREIQDRIFNPFFSTKPAGEGTGLGLSIAYDIIVKEHRGEISFESEEGAFTEFIIRLTI